MDGWRSSSVSYLDHRWQVRARVGRAESDDGHKRELHLAWCHPEMRSCQDGALGGINLPSTVELQHGSK